MPPPHAKLQMAPVILAGCSNNYWFVSTTKERDTMKILLATDGSSCSDAAVSEICRRPWPEGTEVRIITVDAPWTEELLRGRSSSMFDEMNKQLRAEAWQSQRCCSRIQAECTRLNCHPRVPGRSSERYNFRRGGALGWGWKIGDTPL